MFLPDISNVMNSAVATENIKKLSNEEQLRATFSNAGQGHIFQYFDTLSSEGKASLLVQLADIDVDRCNRIFAKATSPQTCSNSIEPLPADSFSSTINPSEADSIKDWKATGLKLIAEGKVAVILLAGGQGTRLGSSAPKGCYDINLPSHKSLFQLQAERILSIQRIARNAYPESQGTGIIPWYVMTSGPTRAATECFFREKNFFGLLEENVMFFNQGVLPAFGMDGKILMEDKG
ncbi:UDP-N-acetylglucosamine pyrophosphorylase, partial [Rhizoclosmatium hyalinum]